VCGGEETTPHFLIAAAILLIAMGDSPLQGECTPLPAQNGPGGGAKGGPRFTMVMGTATFPDPRDVAR